MTQNETYAKADTRQRPLVIFDGACGFCKKWIKRTQSFTGGDVEYAPYQEIGHRFPQVSEESFRHAMKLIDTDGTIRSGADAAFRAIRGIRGRGWLFLLYHKSTTFRRVADTTYAWVAANRPFANRITSFLFGKNMEREQWMLARWVFFRGLGVIFFIAFASLLSQIHGLIGSNGILPAQNLLDAVSNNLGSEKYVNFPTLAWIWLSDTALTTYIVLGMVASMALIVGFATLPSLLLLWVLYLSLFTIGSPFLSFQWDILLLEVTFLSFFLAPLHIWPQGAKREPSRPIIWLFWFLLFRFYLSSAIAKLQSGDMAWADLSALSYHFETQPIPTPLAWHMHHLPQWMLKSGTFIMFVIEIGVPFLLFAPRKIRMSAGWLIIALQVVILMTGNYTYFNWLTILIVVFCFDDSTLRPFITKKVQPKIKRLRRKKLLLGRHIAATLAFIIVLSAGPAVLFRWSTPLQPLFNTIHTPFQTLRSVNSYGLFAVMTKTRWEIVIEGSNDGEQWFPYEFAYKPGKTNRPPPIVAPHQPRLDWQMWFAALGTYERNPWFSRLISQLLTGAEPVTDLLQHNPFPGNPPKFIRAIRYEYQFSDSLQNGEWWVRTPIEFYLPAVSLQ